MLFALKFVAHLILFEANSGKPDQQSIVLLGLIHAVFKPSRFPLWVMVQHNVMLPMMCNTKALF